MRSSGLRDAGVMLVGASVGAGLMYLLDPYAGRRRRALIRNQVTAYTRNARVDAHRRTQDLMNRTRGQVMEWRSRATEGAIDDDTIVQRARAQVGHVVSHPGALQFSAREGVLRITGPALQGDKHNIEDRLRKTRGVRRWDLSGIKEYEHAEHIPGLQGEPRHQQAFGS